MSKRGTYRQRSSLFNIQDCEEIRSGRLIRRGAQEKCKLSANLIQHWLALYDRGELVSEEAEAASVVEYQAKIAALERKVGQLTMELDLLKETPSPRLVSSNESASSISDAAGLSIRQRCEVIGVPRSTFYYRPVSGSKALTDERVAEII